MEAFRLAARLEHDSFDLFEAGFADHVSARALFLSRDVLEVGGDVRVGTSVHLDVLLVTGEPALRLEGVVAWSVPAGQAPPGREAGIGVAVLATDDPTAARLQRMSALPNAGGRVRVPGQRLSQRLRLGEVFSVVVPVVVVRAPMVPGDTPQTLPVGHGLTLDAEADAFLQGVTVELPAPPRPRLMGLLADRALGDSEADGAVANSQPPPSAQPAPPVDEADEAVATASSPAAVWPHTADTLSGALEVVVGDEAASGTGAAAADDDDIDEADALAEAVERRIALAAEQPVSAPPPPGPQPTAQAMAFLEAPTLDGVDDTIPPTLELASRAPPSSTHELSMPGLESLPDAPPEDARGSSPFSPDHARPFESQSTDIDLLSSISAADIVSLDANAQNAGNVAGNLSVAHEPALSEPWRDMADLPSADADVELVGDDLVDHDRSDWEARTDHLAALELGETMVLNLRPLPPPDSWPEGPPSPINLPLGMACSFSRRGQQHVEMFSWPKDATKRYSRNEPGPEPEAVDVFASSQDENLFGAAPAAHDDPFAPLATDPRLSVAVNVEGVVAKNVRAAHGDEEGDVFASVDIGDAPVLPPPAAAEAAPAVPVAVASDADDDDHVDTDRELRRPPPKV